MSIVKYDVVFETSINDAVVNGDAATKSLASVVPGLVSVLKQVLVVMSDLQAVAHSLDGRLGTLDSLLVDQNSYLRALSLSLESVNNKYPSVTVLDGIEMQAPID